MSESLVFLNGKISSPAEAKVSVFDRGFLFGDGVYETGRSYDRCPLFLEEHWSRLRSSAGKLSIPVPWSDADLTRGLFETAKAFGKPDIYYRTIVTRGTIDYVGLDVAAENSPTLVHIVQDLKSQDDKRAQGVRLITSSVQRNSAMAQDPNIKTSNYLNSLLALQDAKRRGGEDAVMCDPQGRVTEGTTFSIFGVTGSGMLITPALSVGILESITRRHVLEIARGIIDVKEGYFELPAFQECKEVFIASSLREVIPVRQWDELTYPVDGEATRKIHAGLKSAINAYVASHAKF